MPYHEIDHVLGQLSTTFTVQDIMVKTKELVRASSENDAQKLFTQYHEYDTIPLPSSGPITAYVCRDEQKVKKIDTIDIISDGTNLLAIPYLLREREYFFVLSSNTITGFIHFSDLNKSLMKLPFFILLEAVEKHLWSPVSRRLNEADLSQVLEATRVKTLISRKESAQKKNVDVGWSGLLSFDEILKFAIHYEVIQITHEDREILATMRNRVAHVDKLLVEAHKDTAKLVKTHELCQKILKGL